MYQGDRFAFLVKMEAMMKYENYFCAIMLKEWVFYDA